MPFIDLLFANVDNLCADEQTVRVLLFIETPSGVTLYQGAPGSKFSKAPPSRSAKGTS